LKGIDYGFEFRNYAECGIQVSSRPVLYITFGCKTQFEERCAEDFRIAGSGVFIRSTDSADQDCSRKIDTRIQD
jgi:hypothetical protein